MDPETIQRLVDSMEAHYQQSINNMTADRAIALIEEARNSLPENTLELQIKLGIVQKFIEKLAQSQEGGK